MRIDKITEAFSTQYPQAYRLYVAASQALDTVRLAAHEMRELYMDGDWAGYPVKMANAEVALADLRLSLLAVAYSTPTLLPSPRAGIPAAPASESDLEAGKTATPRFVGTDPSHPLEVSGIPIAAVERQSHPLGFLVFSPICSIDGSGQSVACCKDSSGSQPVNPWPGTFYPSSLTDLSAACESEDDVVGAKFDQDALDAKIEVIMYAMDCGIGCVLAITDAACIAIELDYKNFTELGQHYSATAVIRDGQLHLTPIA